MSNLSKFILGFALIVLVAGAGALALLQSLSANDIPQTPVPTATVALPLPTSTEVVPTATPTPEPLTPVVRLPSLAWRRDAVAGSECASLSIDEQGVLRYGDCHGHTVVGYLTQDELAAYLGYVSRYASFDLSTADANGQTVRLVGNGSVVASAAERVTVANWAAGVYERLEEIELRKDRAAQARVALAAKLGVPVDAIDTARVEAVTWPDACLGLARDGQMCAQVLTPGYRLEFVVNGVSYEYRSDRRGNLVVELQQAAPTATATPLPTWTPVPTSTPWPTATPYPTATPWPTSTPKPTPYPFTVTDWLGEYYNNTSLSGSPALARNDVDVNYDWGYNSPGWGVNTDHFSARWSRKLWFEDGDYSFTVATDDGVRLWVAGNLLIDRWYGGERSTTVKQQIWRGWHEVVIEYFELEGIARARFTWSRIMPTPTPTLTNQQWVAEYYDNAKLSGQPVIVRNEPEIKFDWALRSPDKLIPVDRFSARFTHKLQFAPGTYELSLVVDDGARLYVDDKLVIDAWQTGIRRELTAQVKLSGEHRVRIEYFENGEGAALFFGWKRVASGAGPANKVPVGAQAPEHTPAPKQR